ncbi:hypothetical protein [Sorangium sp. So ce542]|uniref:hypothetical protein n=1 Tax=Sorangium sp. So ce542 TaxID=3133316 RepID=UPI003F60A670
MSDTKAAPSFFYYAMVDGTSAVDSVAFGKDLDARGGSTGWRNLLDLLAADPADGARLVDPSHDFLPIYKLKRAGSMAAGDPKGISVICPGGLNGEGKDAMWQGFRGGTPVAFPLTGGRRVQLLGRHAAAELSAKFIASFMVNPAIEVDGPKRHIASDATSTKGTLFRASLLYLSSHGWLGGFAKGDELQPYPAASPASAPGVTDDPRSAYVPMAAYFVIGKIDASGKGFSGPEWIVLAQCSTLNNTTWAPWARVMARSGPQVRGILGYEEASPAAVASISIADSFFNNLKAKMPFYEAWKAANRGQNWAAIVHKDAMGDTLAGWAKRPPLSGNALSDYLGSASRAPAQVKIDDPPPPYGVRVFHRSGSSGAEITPDVLDSYTAFLIADDEYRIVISPPSGGDITRVKVQWIHIRDTFQQFGLDRLFAQIVASGSGVTVSRKDPKVVVADYAAAQTGAVEITFTATTEERLRASGLAAHHSYLWPRIHLTGKGMADVRLDMKTRGIGYYG